MTDTQIEESIHNQRLRLTFWEKFDHYTYAWGFSIPIVATIAFAIIENSLDIFLLIVSSILFIPALATIFHYGKKRLHLYKSKRHFDSNNLAYEAAIKAIENLNWTIISENKRNYIRAFRIRNQVLSTDYEIRILIKQGNIYFVSLYYPNMRAEFIEYQNPQNVFDFANEIRNVA